MRAQSPQTGIVDTFVEGMCILAAFKKCPTQLNPEVLGKYQCKSSLKHLSFSAVALIGCMGGWGVEGGEREKKKKQLVICRKVLEVLFHVMGLVLRKSNGTKKNIIIIIEF